MIVAELEPVTPGIIELLVEALNLNGHRIAWQARTCVFRHDQRQLHVHLKAYPWPLLAWICSRARWSQTV